MNMENRKHDIQRLKLLCFQYLIINSVISAIIILIRLRLYIVLDTIGFCFGIPFTTGIFSYIIMVIIHHNDKDKIKDKKIKVILSAINIPVITICVFFTWLLVFAASETDCIWHPLIDTKYSKNFNVYNIKKIENGMTKDEVKKLIGDPLSISNLKTGGEWYIYTGDGAAAPFGKDYSWFNVEIIFKDNKVIEKNIGWMYD